jgi:ApbE superfamily uncharacterized protein (UPF0280 family)
MSGPIRRALAAGREHWRHGPIDLVIQAWGDPGAVAAAYAAAWQRFTAVLGELVHELASLKAPVGATTQVRGPVAVRMVDACLPFASGFITPMAAVAGSVADEMRQFFAVAGIARAYVNNGGDIALHLAPGQTLTVGVVPDAYRPSVDGGMVLDARSPVRGVATSGWRGRSFSLGIADSVTVLARSAAEADAAATVIANAVYVDHPAIQRRHACDLKDDSDLGARLVTVAVGELPTRLAADALDRGAAVADELLGRDLILGAALALQGQWRCAGCAGLTAPREELPAQRPAQWPAPCAA